MPFSRTIKAGSAFLIALALGAWTHGRPTPTFATWHQVVEGIPCQDVARVGHDIRINGTIIVGGQSFQNHVVPEEGQEKILEKRCFPKL
jgi:hypothetical protein